MDSPPDTASTPAAPVLPSRWAQAVLGDSQALGELAGSYWYGVYAWWRRSGLDATQATGATLASFTRWIRVRPPSVEDSGAGLMREWLPARLAELAAEGWELEEEPAMVIEPEWAETRFADEPEGAKDAIFNRRWALTVLEFAMQALRAEYAARGLETLFGEVAPFVGFEEGDEARYAAAAERLGMTAGATRKAVFDFRTHYHDLLRALVADTVADPADLNGEITALLCACELPAAPDAAPARLPTAIRTFKPDELLARAMNTVRMTSGGLGKWQPPSDAEAARLFPQYEMRGLAGRGAMGAVYRARQVALDREVAIKLLPLEVSVDRAFADRFVREARAMAKLSHPNIIGVFNFGTTAEGHLFFVMEFVEGADLSQMIREPGLAPEQALLIAGQVCTALAYAHGKGVVHRDIKPANVMVNTEGTVKVADFGLARLAGADPRQFGQTLTGTIMGTQEYMSPEQKRGMAVDHRADIYSMGVMLYEMLCKEPPQGTFEPPSQRVGCDARIDQIVLKAIHRTPEGRYQSATEMEADLNAARTPLPAPPQRRAAPPNVGVNRPAHVAPPEKSSVGLIAALLLMALLVAGAIYFLNDNRKPVAQAAQPQTPEETSTPAAEIFGPPIPADFQAPQATPAGTVADAEAAAMPPKAPAPESTPSTNSPAAQAPKTAMEKWLDALDGPQQEAFQKQVAQPFAAGVEDLRKSYLAALDAGQAKAATTGKLDAALIWNDERHAFAEAGVVEPDDDTTPAPLRPLRAEYRQRLAKLESERVSRAKPLLASYDAILAKYITLLTQRDRIADALLLKNKREEIAKAWLPMSAPSPVDDKPKVQTPDPAPEELIALADSSARKPDDNFFALRVAALQLWFGRDADFAITAGRMLKVAERSDGDSFAGERAAKVWSLWASSDPAIIRRALVLARRAAKGDAHNSQYPWSEHTLGLAEFRAGYDAAAEAAFKRAESAAEADNWQPENRPFVQSVARFFRAMILFRAGKKAEAQTLYHEAEAQLKPLPVVEAGLWTDDHIHDPLISWLACKEAKALLQIPGPAPGPVRWENLLAKLTPAVVAQTGQGWVLKSGELFSSETKFAKLPLPGSYAGTSYRLRIKLRQVEVKDLFLVTLPVGDRAVGFYVDGNPGEGFDTALACVDGGFGRGQRGAVPGKQIKDAVPHELEVTVRLDGPNVNIFSTLDSRPLHEWTGPIASLSLNRTWLSNPPGATLALGSVANDWVVSEVKAQRLAGAPRAPAQPRPPEVPEPPLVGVRNVQIKANAPMGGRVGPVRAGQSIRVQYVEGRWAMSGGLGSDPKGWVSPDEEVFPGNLIGVYAVLDGEAKRLAEVPAGTKRRPFRYRFDKDYAQVILRIRDDIVEDNAGEVTYSVSLSP